MIKINEYDSLKNIKNNINKSIDEHAIDEIEKQKNGKRTL